jgi:Recombination endonuclease VII
MKRCNKCGTSKELAQFHKHRGYRDGHISVCKACRRDYNDSVRDRRNEWVRGWRKQNPDKQQTYRLKTDYGISFEEYTEILAQQGGVCKICRQPEQLKTKNGKVKLLAVDHDHETDKIRGIICNGCNRAIGYIFNDPSIARAIAEYLEDR